MAWCGYKVHFTQVVKNQLWVGWMPFLGMAGKGFGKESIRRKKTPSNTCQVFCFVWGG
jgi:hypothetical protein